jgi:arylsulfatase A-like enzyme
MTAPRPSDLPTIVLVVLDTARRDRFGCYGYPRPTTPTVDSLARGGTRFDAMVANAPWTLPSHASLFTGLYPTQHGSQWRTGPKPRPTIGPTMAQWLGALGYDTWCVTNNGMIGERTTLSRGFDTFAYRLDLERGRTRRLRRARKVAFGGDSGGRVVNRWMRERLSTARRPLFLFVNYMECHWSYAPPPAYVRKVGGPRHRFPNGMRYRAEVAARVGPWQALAQATTRDLEILSTYYDAELANADHHLEELLDTLGRTGHLRDDGRGIVLVTSDHGEHLGEHGLADHHGSLDELMTHVPFVSWGPGIVPSGTVREPLAEFVDVLPSLAALLGVDPPAEYLERRRTDLFGTGRDGHSYAFTEWRSWTDHERERLAARNPAYTGFDALARDLVAVRDDRMKLVRGSDGSAGLFDLREDPTEERNLVTSRPQDAARLGAQLDARLSEWAAWEGITSDLTALEREEIERRLEDLGYI